MKIILLRGLAREKAHWLDFPKTLKTALQTSSPEAEVECIDCLGCGEFYLQKVGNRIQDLTDHIRLQVFKREAFDNQELFDNQEQYHQLGESKSTERLIVLGISMGGMLAMDWAQRFPAEIAGLILINSSSGSQPLHWRLQWPIWPLLPKSLFATPEQREETFLKIVSNKTLDYGKNLKIWLEIQKRHPVSTKNVLNFLAAAAKFKGSLGANTQGLVLASQKDRLVNHKCSLELARKNRWPIYLHPEAGHDLTLDDPSWVAEKIAAWLEGKGYV